MTTTLDEVLPAVLARAAIAEEHCRRDAEVHARARKLLVRSVACAVAGGSDPLVTGLAGNSGRGDCELLTGQLSVATPAAAAGIHAAAITVSQCDDGLREAAGHPGLHAFSAAWSVGLAADVSLGDVLAAFTAGWEVGAQLGLILGRPRRGIHPHGGWGTAAAAVATAVVTGADLRSQEAAVRAALSVALTGPDSTLPVGAAAHYLLPALGTANGVAVGLLGLDVPETPLNALSHFASVAHPEAAPVVVGSDRPLLMSAYLKPLGLCAHTLTAWQAADELRRDDPDARFVSVRVWTYAAAAALGDSRGRTLLARRFSVPWAVAYGLTGRRPGSDDHDIASLAAAVTVQHAPELDHLYPGTRPARLQFRCADGRTVERAADVHAGDREQPLDDAAENVVCTALLGEGRRTHLRAVLDSLRDAPADTPARTFARRFSSADRSDPTHLEGS